MVVYKIGKLSPKNQYTERKLLNFENWCNEEVSKATKLDFQSQFCMLWNDQNLSQFSFPLKNIRAHFLITSIFKPLYFLNDAKFLTPPYYTNSKSFPFGMMIFRQNVFPNFTTRITIIVHINSNAALALSWWEWMSLPLSGYIIQMLSQLFLIIKVNWQKISKLGPKEI